MFSLSKNQAVSIFLAVLYTVNFVDPMFSSCFFLGGKGVYQNEYGLAFNILCFYLFVNLWRNYFVLNALEHFVPQTYPFPRNIYAILFYRLYMYLWISHKIYDLMLAFVCIPEVFGNPPPSTTQPHTTRTLPNRLRHETAINGFSIFNFIS